MQDRPALPSNHPRLHYLAAAVIGLGLAAWIFTIPVLLGTGPFWQAPNYPDMQQHLAAARYFLADSWRFPLFLTRLIIPPEGVSVVFLDVNPLLALADKILFKTTGHSVNYFGPWIALCFALQAVAFLFLCRVLGLRGWIATIAAAVIALSVPEFLFRYFHLNLLGQFFITAQLALYFDIVRNGRRDRLGWAVALPLICLLVHFYTFAMVAALLAVTLAESFVRQPQQRRGLILWAGGFVIGTGLLFVASGYLHGAGGSTGFGYFSMNLLSPIVPQQSGLFGMPLIVDATGGQYEGYNYLGAGVLLLAAIGLGLAWREIPGLVRRYRFLLALFGAFTIFALSFNPFVGDFSLTRMRVEHRAREDASAAQLMPLPKPAAAPQGAVAKIKELVFYPLQQFRSSGRFFWPIGYAIAAFGIVMVSRKLPPRSAAALLAVAAMLQAIDAGPLRAAISDAIRRPSTPPIPAKPWETLIALHRSITVLPSMDCAGKQSPLIPMFVYYASASVTPTHSAKLSRGPKADCPAEMDALKTLQIGADDLVVLMTPPIPTDLARAVPQADALCRPFALGLACSHHWTEIDAAGIVLDPTPAPGAAFQPFDARNVGRD